MRYLTKINKNQNGGSLIEILIAVVIFFTIGSAVIAVMLFSLDSLAKGGEFTQANALAQEGIEAIRSIQERAWNENSYNQSGLYANSGIWDYLGEGTTETIGKYTRIITFDDVCRDSNNEISACPDLYIDMNSKVVNVEVSWETRFGVMNSVRRITYLTNWDSKNWFEDTEADFSDGIFDKTEVSLSAGDSDGAIVLSNVDAMPAWNTVTEEYIYNASGNNDAISVSVKDDFLFFSQRHILRSFDISNPESPVFLDSRNFIGGQANSMYIIGNYLFAATSSNARELQIIDIGNPADMNNIGFFNAYSNSDATDVFVSGNRAYLTTMVNNSGSINPEFYIIDVSNPYNPVLAQATSYYEVGYNVNAVEVSGNFAYLATANPSNELIILDISNESNPIVSDSFNILGSVNLIDITIDGNYAYAISGSSYGRFYSFDISDPSNVSLADFIDYPSNNFNRVKVSDGFAFIAGEHNSQEIIIVDISNPNLMSAHNTIDYYDDVNDICVKDGYLFVVSDSNNAELGIFSSDISYPGGGYEEEGTYISSPFDTGFATRALQLIKWTADIPVCTPECSVKIQVRSADLEANLNSSEWCGPEGKDGNETDYFTQSYGDLISKDHNGDRWIQYKAVLSGDGNMTPALSDITINYK